jgi:ATP-dependent RNA helicase RhlE
LALMPLTEDRDPRQKKAEPLNKLFTEMPLSAFVQERLAKSQFITPTPVQGAAIPPALEGKDVLATAQTGTGKTLAFMLPAMEMLLKTPGKSVEVLVLVPTRELAMQVAEVYNDLRGNKLPAAAVLVGGMSENAQIKSLQNGARIVVATPGRLEDLQGRGLMKYGALKMIVLDEADRMLDMGFIPAIRRIMSKLPKQRQTMCFSATLEPSVVHLINDYMKNPVRCAFGSTLKPVDAIKLQMFEVGSDKKYSLLLKLLNEEKGRSLVFTRTKRSAERVANKLEKAGLSAEAIHGDRSQSQRNAALKGFQDGKYQILVATDLASRGIHVDDIMHVINFDLPEIAEDFVHRVGRTARAGGSGVASTFVTGADVPDFKALERQLNLKMDRMRVDETHLEKEEKMKAVDVSGLVPIRKVGKSKMVLMPGESLRRYENA